MSVIISKEDGDDNRLTFAREILKKHTLINIPLIVTCLSPNLIPSKYSTLKLYAEIKQFSARILYI